ncbi:MAG: hypothetical protein QS721_01515 [Candidatus Endonucleobacter sp. (ex Gigantidas childressi)]|nr:hypothetical protein [Candidatus Endonucleobacter sp. (ex Gigantidas childressi)]
MKLLALAHHSCANTPTASVASITCRNAETPNSLSVLKSTNDYQDITKRTTNTKTTMYEDTNWDIDETSKD